MAILVFLIIIGILVAGGFLIGFIWSVKSGQYDDMYSPAVRVLFDEQLPGKKKEQPEQENSKEEVEEKTGGDSKATDKINQSL